MDKSGFRISGDISYSVPEHEVLISFDDDDAAAAFYEWWETHGADAFVEYVKENFGEDF